MKKKVKDVTLGEFAWTCANQKKCFGCPLDFCCNHDFAFINIINTFPNEEVNVEMEVEE